MTREVKSALARFLLTGAITPIINSTLNQEKPSKGTLLLQRGPLPSTEVEQLAVFMCIVALYLHVRLFQVGKSSKYT